MEGTELPITVKKRYNSPDVFKGIAMIVIVFIHLFFLVGATGHGHGEVVKTHPVLEILYTGLIVFFIISGYFYNPNRTYWENAKKRLIKIGGTLLVCCIGLSLVMYLYMLACGYQLDPPTIMGILDGIVDVDVGKPIMGSNGEETPLELWFVANGYYFLRVLLVASLIFYAIVDWTLKDKKNLAIAIVILLSSTAVMLWYNKKLPFNFEIVPLAVSFMLIGANLAKYDFLDWIENKWKTPTYWIVIGISLCIAIIFAILTPSHLGLNSSILGDPAGPTTFSFFILSLSGGLVVYTIATFFAKIPRLSDILAYIGVYSLGIFALHTFFIKILTAWTGEYTTDSILISLPLWATVVVGLLSIVLSILAMDVSVGILKEIRKRKSTPDVTP